MLLFLLSLLFDEPATIANPMAVKGSQYTLVLKEDLRFGADEDEDAYIWSEPETGVAVGQDGHIYVVDKGESRILEFDGQGQFIREVAHKGQGPGELQSLGSLHFLNDGSAVAVEALIMAVPRFHFFDKDMKYKETKTPLGAEKYHSQVVFSPTGKFFASRFLSFSEEGKRFDKVGLFDHDLNLVRLVGEREQSMQMRRLSEPAYLSQYLAESLVGAFKSTGILAFGSDGKLYEAQSDAYEVKVWDPSLKKQLLVVKKNYKPIPNKPSQVRGVLDAIADGYRPFSRMHAIMTDDFLQKVVDTTEVPPAKNPIVGIVPMPNDFFLVVHDLNTVTGEQTADIFNEKGRFLGQVSTSRWSLLNQKAAARMVFTKTHAYTIETDEEGDNRVVRFKWSLAPKK